MISVRAINLSHLFRFWLNLGVRKVFILFMRVISLKDNVEYITKYCNVRILLNREILIIHAKLNTEEIVINNLTFLLITIIWAHINRLMRARTIAILLLNTRDIRVKGRIFCSVEVTHIISQSM